MLIPDSGNCHRPAAFGYRHVETKNSSPENTNLIPRIRSAYEKLGQNKDVMIVSGSGSMFSGKYCNVDGISVVRALGIKSIIIDRYVKELN